MSEIENILETKKIIVKTPQQIMDYSRKDTILFYDIEPIINKYISKHRLKYRSNHY